MTFDVFGQCLPSREHVPGLSSLASAKVVSDCAASVSTAADSGSDIASDSEVLAVAELAQAVPQTSLMIRNVPVLYSKEMLLAEWPNDGSYDFFYLPWNAETQRNLSYAFLNFTSEAAALAFVQRWQKQRLPHYNSRKPLNISFADVQGLAENLRALQKKRVNLDQCQAVVFQRGARVCLREAMAALKQPIKKSRVQKQKAMAESLQRTLESQAVVTIFEGQIFSV